MLKTVNKNQIEKEIIYYKKEEEINASQSNVNII